jgi:hypothetical protein
MVDDVELTEALERAAINLSDAMTGGGVFAVHGRRADEVMARIQRREEGIMSSLITLNNVLREIDKRRKGVAARPLRSGGPDEHVAVSAKN